MIFGMHKQNKLLYSEKNIFGRKLFFRCKFPHFGFLVGEFPMTFPCYFDDFRINSENSSRKNIQFENFHRKKKFRPKIFFFAIKKFILLMHAKNHDRTPKTDRRKKTTKKWLHIICCLDTIWASVIRASSRKTWEILGFSRFATLFERSILGVPGTDFDDFWCVGKL